MLEYLCEVLQVRSAADIEKLPRANVKIAEILKGVSVVTTHRPDQRHRFKVSKITNDSPNSYKFAPEEGKPPINVTQYFKTHYKINLKYPNMPLIWKANGKTGFPVEVLAIVPSQRYTKRLTGDQTTDMIRATTQKPHDRQKSIMDAVQRTLKYQNNQFMASFGFEVEPKMMEFKARVLPAPKVVFRGKKTANASDGEASILIVGSWNISKYKLVDTPQLDSLAFIFFVRVDSNKAQAIRDKIVSKWVDQGMNITDKSSPFFVVNPNSPQSVLDGLVILFLIF